MCVYTTVLCDWHLTCSYCQEGVMLKCSGDDWSESKTYSASKKPPLPTERRYLSVVCVRRGKDFWSGGLKTFILNSVRMSLEHRKWMLKRHLNSCHRNFHSGSSMESFFFFFQICAFGSAVLLSSETYYLVYQSTERLCLFVARRHRTPNMLQTCLL